MLSTVSILATLAAGVFAPPVAPPAPPVTLPQAPFAVSFYPANPLVGEAVHVQVTGAGEHVTETPIEENANYCMVEWDFGEAGAAGLTEAYAPEIQGRSYDMNTGYGHKCVHAYGSAGNKTVTVKSWVFGGDIKTQTFTIPVADPENVSWTHDYYVDLTGSTVGMPAETGVIKHITSWASYMAVSGTHVAGNNVRWRFRAGTTHLLSFANGLETMSLKGDLNYVQSFGGGSLPLLKENAASYFEAQAFAGDLGKVVFRDIDFDGRYDPRSGRITGARTTFYRTDKSAVDVSAYKCKFMGADIPLRGSSGDVNAIGMVGCFSKDAQDFGLVYSGGAKYLGVKSNTGRMPFYTPRGDGKGTTASDFPDHGFVRSEKAHHVAVLFNKLDRQGGWSGWGGDVAVQPAFRIHSHTPSPEGTGGCVMFNTVTGGLLAAFGAHSPEGTGPTSVVSRYLVVGNDFDFAGQAGTAIGTGTMGGVTAYSNVIYKPAVAEGQYNGNIELFSQSNRFGASDAVWNEPNRIFWNTLVSDKPEANVNPASNTVMRVWSIDVQEGAVVETGHNLLSADGHKSGSMFATSALSRGDAFRPITGGAAATLIDGGPPINFDMTRNTAGITQTVVGAHGVAGANVVATAPTWTVTPTMGVMDYDTAVAVGIVSPYPEITTGNSNPNLEWNWYANGTINKANTDDRRWVNPVQFPIAGTYANLTTVVGYPSGTVLTLKTILTNRSGARVQVDAIGSYTVP